MSNQSKNALPVQEACWAAFINRVRDNLHCVLAMSPVGGAFRARCRMFPSLINCCTIDWYRPWPDQALLSVSTQTLAPLDLPNPQIKPALASMCVHIHTSVAVASDKMFAQLRRRYPPALDALSCTIRSISVSSAPPQSQMSCKSLNRHVLTQATLG